MSTTPGPLYRFFSDDHRRLDDVLSRACADASRVDSHLYEQFRGGLLRHIGMEEKVLLPAARRARAGVPLEIARPLRLDHGAIAALLVPTPTPDRVVRIRSILAPHNRREEEPGGLYETCDLLLADEAVDLISRLEAFPSVPLAPCGDSPLVERHIAEALDLARKGWGV